MLPSVGSPILWVGFLAGIGLLLLLDLGVFHRKTHVIGVREALIWSVVWVVLSLMFNGFVWVRFGAEPALEFLGAYLIEKALSVDNLFVFLVIFRYMNVQPHVVHRVLFAGILGALILRGAFIGVGLSLIQMFSWMLHLFGAFLVFTGIKLLFTSEDEAVDPSDNVTYRFARRFLPLSGEYSGHRFFVREHGLLRGTPLLVVLLMVETSDVVFALDSIPAAFGISRDPFIVFTSNVCAVLGLRAMFFLLQSFLDRFAYLKYGLGLVLSFIGAKMILGEGWGLHLPIGWSLAVVFTLIGGSVLVSIVRPPADGPAEHLAHAPPSSMVAEVPPPVGEPWDPGSDAFVFGRAGLAEWIELDDESRHQRASQLLGTTVRAQAVVSSRSEVTDAASGARTCQILARASTGVGAVDFRLTLGSGCDLEPGDRIAFAGEVVEIDPAAPGAETAVAVTVGAAIAERMWVAEPG